MLTSWHPNGTEVTLLSKLNTARSNPKLFGEAVDKWISKEGKGTCSCRDVVSRYRRKQQAVGSLRMSFVLSQLAKMQCDDICRADTKDYVNNYELLATRTSLFKRLDLLKVPHDRCVDIVEFGGCNATEILYRFVTSGTPETIARHWTVIFDPGFDYVGVAECTHPKVGRICCVAFSRKFRKTQGATSRPNSSTNIAMGPNIRVYNYEQLSSAEVNAQANIKGQADLNLGLTTLESRCTTSPKSESKLDSET